MTKLRYPEELLAERVKELEATIKSMREFLWETMIEITRREEAILTVLGRNPKPEGSD